MISSAFYESQPGAAAAQENASNELGFNPFRAQSPYVPKCPLDRHGDDGRGDLTKRSKRLKFMGMERTENKGRRLDSWKEIASHLDCHPRTCRRWIRKHELPVHQLKKNSRVFAWEKEIDEWWESHPLVHKTGKPARPRWQFLLIVFTSLLGAVLVLFAVKPTALQGVDGLSSFRIEGSFLVALDAKSRELWRFNTRTVNLAGTVHYMSRFQKKRFSDKNGTDFPALLIRDLDRDGRKETLFSIETDDESGEGELLCLNHRGEEEWRFNGGRDRSFRDLGKVKGFSLTGFDVLDLNSDGYDEVLVISRHRPFFPTQMALLSHDGKRMGEYWNSGRIHDYASCDIDKDGKMELLVAGTNNEFNTGCLIVFDPDRIRGASPQGDKYRCLDCPQGLQEQYILLPSTRINESTSDRERIEHIEIAGDTILLFGAVSRVYYRLGFDLALKQIIPSDSFARAWSLQPGGEGMSAYLEQIRGRTRYFNQGTWKSSPL
jgi:hypothetical protein